MFCEIVHAVWEFSQAHSRSFCMNIDAQDEIGKILPFHFTALKFKGQSCHHPCYMHATCIAIEYHMLYEWEWEVAADCVGIMLSCWLRQICEARFLLKFVNIIQRDWMISKSKGYRQYQHCTVPWSNLTRERERDKNTNSVIWCFRAMWWWLLNSTLCNGVWWILYNGQSELFRIIFNHGWTEIRLNVRWPYFSVGLLNESFPSAIQTTYYTYRK